MVFGLQLQTLGLTTSHYLGNHTYSSVDHILFAFAFQLGLVAILTWPLGSNLQDLGSVLSFLVFHATHAPQDQNVDPLT